MVVWHNSFPNPSDRMKRKVHVKMEVYESLRAEALFLLVATAGHKPQFAMHEEWFEIFEILYFKSIHECFE